MLSGKFVYLSVDDGSLVFDGRDYVSASKCTQVAMFNYPTVVALLHFDGANNSTIIADSSPLGLQWKVVGNAFISTAKHASGNSSLRLGGAGYVRPAYTAAAAAYFEFGKGDFSVGQWVALDSTSGVQTVVARANASGTSIALRVNDGVPELCLRNAVGTEYVAKQQENGTITNSSNLLLFESDPTLASLVCVSSDKKFLYAAYPGFGSTGTTDYSDVLTFNLNGFGEPSPAIQYKTFVNTNLYCAGLEIHASGLYLFVLLELVLICFNRNLSDGSLIYKSSIGLSASSRSMVVDKAGRFLYVVHKYGIDTVSTVNGGIQLFSTYNFGFGGDYISQSQSQGCSVLSIDDQYLYFAFWIGANVLSTSGFIGTLKCLDGVISPVGTGYISLPYYKVNLSLSSNGMFLSACGNDIHIFSRSLYSGEIDTTPLAVYAQNGFATFLNNEILLFRSVHQLCSLQFTGQEIIAISIIPNNTQYNSITISADGKNFYSGADQYLIYGSTTYFAPLYAGTYRYIKASRTSGVFALQLDNDIVASQALDIDLSFDATAPYTLGAMVRGTPTFATTNFLTGYIDEHSTTKTSWGIKDVQSAPQNIFPVQGTEGTTLLDFSPVWVCDVLEKGDSPPAGVEVFSPYDIIAEDPTGGVCVCFVTCPGTNVQTITVN